MHEPIKSQLQSRSNKVHTNEVSRWISPCSSETKYYRNLGNQRIAQEFRSSELPIQRKLEIGETNDQYEKEADRVADQVMSMPDADTQDLGSTSSSLCHDNSNHDSGNTPIQRHANNEVIEKEESAPISTTASKEFSPLIQKPTIQRYSHSKPHTKSNNNIVKTVSSRVTKQINQIRQGGQVLSNNTRSFFEPRFGQDFGQVRVHTSVNANNTAKDINAKAYTLGNNIVFAAGQYQPDSYTGKRLLAHELTHVVQQQHLATTTEIVQRDEADDLMRDLAIDTRGFDELWREFERHRDADENEQALQLVRPILVRMDADQAVRYAGELAFWLIQQDEQALAVEAINELENGWWMRFIERGGEGVPDFIRARAGFGTPVGPNDLIDRAEELAHAGSHVLAIQLFATAHLLLMMQLHQLVDRQIQLLMEIGGEEVYSGSILRLLYEVDERSILSQRGRILNFYPLMSAVLMEQGNADEAQHIGQFGETLIAEIRSQSLLPVDIVGPSAASAVEVPPPVSGRGAPATPEAVEEAIPSEEQVEAEEQEQPEPPRPRAANRIIHTPPPFQDALVMMLMGNNYYHARSERHAIAGSLGAAVNYAEILFPTTGAVIAERLGGDVQEFVISGINPDFPLSDVRQRQVRERPDLIGVSGTVFLRAGDNHVIRAVFTTNAEAYFVPGGEVLRTDRIALIERFQAERQTDVEEGRAAVSPAQIQQEVFEPIDRLIQTGDEDRIEEATEQLADLNAAAYSVLPWETRARYLQLLIDSDPGRDEERAIVEILKSIEDRSRFDAVVHQLQTAGVWEDLVDQLNHEIWSLLVVVGERFGNREPFTAQRVAGMMLEARLLRPYPGIAIGPDGPEISINALAEIEEAGRSFIRFLGTTLDAIVMLITEPDKIIEGLAQLSRMILIWKLADLGHQPSIETRARMLARVSEQILNGIRGLEVLDEHIEGIVRRVKWALIWEIASLFIGVGEIRAAIRGVGLGERVAALARFVRLLGLTGRVAEGERAVSQLTRLARVMRRSTQVLNTEDDILRLLSHLPEDDVQRIGRALEGIDIDDTGDLARLAATHPELAEIAQRSLREIEVMSEFAAKAGGSLSDEIVRGFRHLHGRMSADEVSDLVRLVPDGQGERFARALRSLEGIDGIPNSILRSIAESAVRMDAIQTFGARVYMATYRRATGELGTLDGILQALGSRRATMNPTEFQHMLDELASGNSTQWRRFLRSEPGLRQQAPTAAHNLLQRTPGPYTWDPVGRRYTRAGHGNSTEVVEVYGDGRIRFWREQADGSLTDEAVQYGIAPHGNQPSPRGGMTLQSNHGIQDRWVEEHFGGIIESDEVPAILLTNSRTGSQHRAITSSQSTRAASRASDPARSGPWDATYWEIRQALIDDHVLAGVPQSYIDRLVAESDRIFLPHRNNPALAHLFPAGGAP